jgi:hypothetical protein
MSLLQLRSFPPPYRRYDTAISTACGALNWLVVATTEGAQACVEFLRAKGLGRAKFIILDKMQASASRMDAPFPAAPEGAPRLFDLVKIRDAAMRPAFYFALRDTLVATTIDQAVRIGYAGGRGATHRVVALTGELVDASGTMSGGGSTAKKGGMAAVAAAAEVDPAEIAAAEAAAAAANAELSQLRTRKATLATELRELDRALPKFATRIAKLALDVAAGMRAVAELQVGGGWGRMRALLSLPGSSDSSTAAETATLSRLPPHPTHTPSRLASTPLLHAPQPQAAAARRKTTRRRASRPWLRASPRSTQPTAPRPPQPLRSSAASLRCKRPSWRRAVSACGGPRRAATAHLRPWRGSSKP